ncbi:MAG: FtsQ-type POTRA domain-containing protein [Clostridia bacterium]|nr:FtsQ-type POTRA domain-containing protein [Clostridia bacterium]MDD4386896.1 FtsQ-type POTRA domain-containing protein [Clostridia bacterium]
MDKGSKKSRKKVSGSKLKSKSKALIQKKSIKGKLQTKTKRKANNKIKVKKTITKKLMILVTVIIISLFIIASSYYLIKSPKFNITSITVVGNNKINIEDIITMSKINLGDNVVESLFKIDRKNISNIPYISNINLSINFPSELVIKITERESIYYAYDKEKNVYYRLDKNGIILEVCNKIELKEKEILINGITFDDDVKLSTKINDIDYSKIQVYRKIEEEFNNIFLEKKITKVTFENSLTKIYINDKIEVILLNDTDLKYNLTFLKDIISNVGDVNGTVDMTKENPTFITF